MSDSTPEKGDKRDYNKDARPKRGQSDRNRSSDSRSQGDRKPRRDGDFKPRRDGDSRPRRDGDFKPRSDRDSRPRRDGDFKPRREGDSSPRRDGDSRPRRDGDFKPRREGEFKPRRDGDSRPRRDGDFKPRREGEFKPRREGEFKPRRDGDSRARRDGDFKPRRDGDFKPRREGDFKPRRDGDSRPRRDGDFKPRREGEFKPRREDDTGGRFKGGTRGGGRPDRGGADREFTEAERLEHSLRPVRERHFDPELPEDIMANELHPGARNELKTLDKELADIVAKHLAMVARLIDEDPQLANQHAISAMRKAGRIPVTRETFAITSYINGDYATALRELRTYRRLSGSQEQLALMIDCERALGRPEKAIETANEVERSKLSTEQQVQVAIALSGARLDLGQSLQALYELEIEQLKPNQAFSWSPELFAAYSTVLEDLGRFSEAKTWQKRAYIAEEALNEQMDGGALEVFEIVEEDLEPEGNEASEDKTVEEATEETVDEAMDNVEQGNS